MSVARLGTGTIGLESLIIDKPAKDACDPEAGTIDVGPSVDDLVTFLEGQPLVEISENTDVTVDGYRGRYLEYTTHGSRTTVADTGPWPAITSGLATASPTRRGSSTSMVFAW